MNILINLNKPKGITSNDALVQVKRLMKAKKAGHAGTLDPLAEGVLLIGFNEATKIFPYLSGLDKEYEFTVCLGIDTDTYDAEGSVVEERGVKDISIEAVRAMIPHFSGDIEQVPPRFSALKFKGKPMYDYARKGIVIDPPKRVVSVFKLELLSFDLPLVTFQVACSTGTYVRSLCNDMGNFLGTGAHITMLKRTRIGPFSIDDSVIIGDLPLSSKGMLSIDTALAHLPALRLTHKLTTDARHGRAISLSSIHDSGCDGTDCRGNRLIIRLLDPSSRTFALGRIKGGEIKIERVLNIL